MDKNANLVFVDSNFFIALFNPGDSLHKKATTESNRIKKDFSRLIISNLIFLEIVTIISQRINKKAAITLGTHILQDNQVEIIHIDKTLQDNSWAIFQKIDKKNVSFVDCSIIAVMKFMNVKKLLTFDKEDFGVLNKMHSFKFYNYQ